MQDETDTGGGDSAAYPELSRANLLRMRGEYDEARAVCLSILRRFPNNVTSHTLLGDICAEVGDLEHAAEWYEIALELDPGNAADEKKLASVRRRIEEHEAAATAIQLGIPRSRSKAKVFAVLVATIVVVFGVGGFFFGDYLRSKRTAPLVDTPIELESGSPPTSPPVDSSTTSGGGSAEMEPSPQAVTPPEPPRVEDDVADLARLKSQIASSELLIDVRFDPRAGGAPALLSLRADGVEDVRALMAEIGESVLDRAGMAKVTMRAVQGGKVILIADLEKVDLDALPKSEDGKRDRAQVVGLLKNIWERPVSATSG